jgi:uncharacterized membrane protein YoaK (UPF0700 family)
MRRLLRLTVGAALAAALTLVAGGAALAAPAPDAGCVAKVVAQDRAPVRHWMDVALRRVTVPSKCVVISY